MRPIAKLILVLTPMCFFYIARHLQFITNVDNDLPSADDEIYPENSIFFHKISRKCELSCREACAVESAARLNPRWQINVLCTGQMSKYTVKRAIIEHLKSFKNVKLGKINVIKYSKTTPAESILRIKGTIRKSRFRDEHTADILRILTLNKHGGICLDLDMYNVKSFDPLPKNWVALQSDNETASGAVAMSKDEIGRNFTESALRDIKIHYLPDVKNHLGSNLIRRMLEKICTTKDLLAMFAKTCNGLDVFKPPYFYPVHYSSWRVFSEARAINFKEAYTIHTWSSTEQVNGESFIAKVAKQYCPKTFGLCGHKFGSL